MPPIMRSCRTYCTPPFALPGRHPGGAQAVSDSPSSSPAASIAICITCSLEDAGHAQRARSSARQALARVLDRPRPGRRGAGRNGPAAALERRGARWRPRSPGSRSKQRSRKARRHCPFSAALDSGTRPRQVGGADRRLNRRWPDPRTGCRTLEHAAAQRDEVPGRRTAARSVPSASTSTYVSRPMASGRQPPPTGSPSEPLAWRPILHRHQAREACPAVNTKPPAVLAQVARSGPASCCQRSASAQARCTVWSMLAYSHCAFITACFSVLRRPSRFRAISNQRWSLAEGITTSASMRPMPCPRHGFRALLGPPARSATGGDERRLAPAASDVLDHLLGAGAPKSMSMSGGSLPAAM